MLNRCARCILCKREALPEAMQSVAHSEGLLVSYGSSSGEG